MNEISKEAFYREPFYLKGEKGNNAFSYELRRELRRKQGVDEPKLYVPPIREGKLEDISLGEEPAFEDVDEFGKLQSCKGLKFFLKSEWHGVPLVVFDNHNHAFYFWFEAWKRGVLKNGATLIHVDQHKDSRRPEKLFDGKTLEDAFLYTQDVLNVGNYIVPAVEMGLVGEIVNVTGESDLENHNFFDEKNKILNIDLDFFAPELSYIDFEKVKSFLLRHAEAAALITVATSPFFIDQKTAIDALSRMCYN